MNADASPTTAASRARVALAGNPNTGKTTLFNRLTGSRAKVGNYPGVTVEEVVGAWRLSSGAQVDLVDVPGTYSLAARSAEEEVALRAIAGLDGHTENDAVLLVLDASQLERNLYLALQVLSLGLPTVVALNMVDLAQEQRRTIDAQALGDLLGVTVLPIVAARGEGLEALAPALERALADPAPEAPAWLQAGSPLAGDLEAIVGALPREWTSGAQNGDARRTFLAAWAMLSIDDEDELDGVPLDLRATVAERRQDALAQGRDPEEEIVRAHYAWIDARRADYLQDTDAPRSWTDRIDAILMHPALGFVAFLALMTVVFQSLFAWSDPMIGAIETAVGAIGTAVEGVLPPGLVTDFLVQGVVAGVGGVLVFLPQILLLFFFIGLMEDTGYMARVAVLMDRLMKAMGLHGRAFVPMLSGFACAVPAILATRTMERRRDRMLTMMVVPLMSCSARLPVYGLLIAALVPVGEEESRWTQGLLLVGMYLFSTVVAIIAAGVLGKTLFRGPRVPFVIEMPPYRMPHWPSVLRMMLRRASQFLREAGTVILACTIAMWALLSFPRDYALAEDFAAERALIEAQTEPRQREERLAELDAAEVGAQLRQSYAGRMGRAIEPVIEPLGFDWQIGIGLIGAFAAREVFVSTMAVVYGLSDEEDETSTTLRERIRQQERDDGSAVYTPLVCFSLMVFFALACQCMSTLAVIKRETGYRWAVFAFVYMTALAWVASFAVYQGGKMLGYL